jgi:hypothetical protein
MKVEYVVKYIDSNNKKFDAYLEGETADVADGDTLADAVRFESIYAAAYHAERLGKENECTYIVVPIIKRRAK